MSARRGIKPRPPAEFLAWPVSPVSFSLQEAQRERNLSFSPPAPIITITSRPCPPTPTPYKYTHARLDLGGTRNHLCEGAQKSLARTPSPCQPPKQQADGARITTVSCFSWGRAFIQAASFSLRVSSFVHLRYLHTYCVLDRDLCFVSTGVGEVPKEKVWACLSLSQTLLASPAEVPWDGHF